MRDAVLTLGHLAGYPSDIAITAVTIDSRLAAPGCAFYAFVGERVDGHAYVEEAFAAGAVVAFVERTLAGIRTVRLEQVPALTSEDLPVAVLVPSAMAALQQAAARYRGKLPLQVVGVTGSVGKTTAKEAIAAVLSQGYKVLKSEGNANNEIGLPLTLLRARPSHQVAVLEMGMYALGEIELLCQVARPRVGVVTNVQPVHLGRLGSIDCIAAAKAELIAALPADGVAVLNGDDARVAAMAGLHSGFTVLVGWAAAAQVRIVGVATRGLEGITLTLDITGLEALGVAGTLRQLDSDMLGRHAAMPVALAVAVGLAQGLEWAQIGRGLQCLGRGPRLIPRPGRRDTTILDDVYNASPAAVAGALDLLAGLPGRRVAILGDMLELGAAEEVSHREVGALCARCVDLLIVRGERARLLARAARDAGLNAAAVLEVDDNEGALAILDQVARPGDIILVKGSRGMAMEGIVDGWRREEPT